MSTQPIILSLKKRIICHRKSLPFLSVLTYRYVLLLRIEVKLLEHLRDNDPEEQYNMVKTYDYFYFRNHLCITFECLSVSVSSNHQQPFTHPSPWIPWNFERRVLT